MHTRMLFLTVHTSATIKAKVLIPEWQPTTTHMRRQKVAMVRIMPSNPKSLTCVLRGVVAENDSCKAKKKKNRYQKNTSNAALYTFMSVCTHSYFGSIPVHEKVLLTQNIPSKAQSRVKIQSKTLYSLQVSQTLCKQYAWTISAQPWSQSS